MWESASETGKLGFWAHRNKRQALDCAEFINSLPFCDDLFSCQLVFSRKYSDIFLLTVSSPNLLSFFPVGTKVGINTCLVDLYAFFMECV